jgi:hypothetical protein
VGEERTKIIEVERGREGGVTRRKEGGREGQNAKFILVHSRKTM